jgi:hypothetical protein
MADKKIKNLNDVRDRLETLYVNLENGRVRAADAKEMANIAGKMISSGKLSLERKVFMKDKSAVPFLDC